MSATQKVVVGAVAGWLVVMIVWWCLTPPTRVQPRPVPHYRVRLDQMSEQDFVVQIFDDSGKMTDLCFRRVYYRDFRTLHFPFRMERDSSGNFRWMWPLWHRRNPEIYGTFEPDDHAYKPYEIPVTFDSSYTPETKP